MRGSLVLCWAGAAAALLVTPTMDAALAQSRKKLAEPPPLSEPIPHIADDTAKCSFAYHAALERVRDGDVKQLVNLDKLARATEPGLPGRWLFWAKTGKGAAKLPQPERVCAQSVLKAGRERCIEWATKPLDPVKVALFAAQPTPEELNVLRVLDAFVTDKGAALEFGSNGRQYATLQRVAIELGAYSAQPKHPALCNGVPEMLEFKAEKLAAMKKRAEDAKANAAKALSQARQRVIAARELRPSEERAAAQAKATSDAANVAPAAPRSPSPSPLPPAIGPAALIGALLDGAVPADKFNDLRPETNALRLLQRARDLITPEATPDLSPASRASMAAALRMIEAASYGEVQVARMQRFDRLFFGTIGQIRDAHRANCTCGD